MTEKERFSFILLSIEFFIMTYAYIRVSTDKQDGANQKLGIEDLCKRKGLCIDEYIDDEGVSGTREPDKRQLGKLLNKLQKEDILIASELSRLGRSLFMIMRILEHCMTIGVKLYTVKDNYELGDNIQSKVLAFAFGLSAEIERNLISQRTKEALDRKKNEGIHIGRKEGKRNNSLNKVCIENHSLIIDELEKGISIPKIAKKLMVSKGTLYRYLSYSGLFIPSTRNWGKGIY